MLMLRRASAALVAVLLLGGCQARQMPAPIGVRLLEIGRARRLSDRAALSPVAWAPDGRRLAFSDKDGVWVASLDGRTRKVTAAGTVTAVDWSRGTGLLAYIDRGVVWVVDPSSARRRRLMLPAMGATRDGGGSLAAHVTWAPVGDRLATVARPAPRTGRGAAGNPGRSGVVLLGADGRLRKTIFESAAGQEVTTLQWFPDGLYVLIGITQEGAITHLLRWRITYPDRTAIPLTRQMFDARLSPNGRWLALTGPEPGGGADHTWAVRTDGTGLRRLSGVPGRITSLDWAPASDKVAFARVLGEARAEIWIADLDGGGRVRAAEFVAEFPDPNLPVVVRWAPDGRHLAFGTNSGAYTGPIWVIGLDRR